MQYVKKKLNKSDSLRTRESHKNTLCSQSRDNHTTHILNMGCGAVGASKEFLIAKNPPTCERGLFCKPEQILTAQNPKLSSRSKQICNFSSAAAIYENYCLKLPFKKVLARKNFPTIVPTVNLALWDLYVSKLATGPFRFATRPPKILIKKWFIGCEFFVALFRTHIDICQVFSPYLRSNSYCRPLGILAPVPRE